MNAAERYERVSQLIFQERQSQDSKWGWPQNNSLPIWMTVLGEEYGETCQEVLRVTYGGKPLDDFVAEMVQVAAVAVAALEDLDEQGLIDLSDMNSNVTSNVCGVRGSETAPALKDVECEQLSLEISQSER